MGRQGRPPPFPPPPSASPNTLPRNKLAPTSTVKREGCARIITVLLVALDMPDKHRKVDVVFAPRNSGWLLWRGNRGGGGDG